MNVQLTQVVAYPLPDVEPTSDIHWTSCKIFLKLVWAHLQFTPVRPT